VHGAGRRGLLGLIGLVGLAGAAALAVLGSAAPQPVVLIGDQPAGASLEGGRLASAASPSARDSTLGIVAVAELVVDVGGAVGRPGVYRLPAGSRVGDAVREAGGFSPAIDVAAVERSLNLAASLTDGAKLHVPSLGDVAPPPAAPTTTGTIGQPPSGGSGAGGRLDLNRATPEELDTLPGIGPVTAAKIIAAREERPFGSVDELDERGVVGPTVLARLRELVSVGQ
jgi:competence protein ComEA